MKKILAILAMSLPLVLSSCLKDEVYGGVTFKDVENNDAYTELDQVTVKATLESFVDIQEVILYYSTDDGKNYSSVQMASAGDKVYTGVIPGYAKDTKVTYYMTAKTASMTGTSSNYSYTVGSATPDYTLLRLNEINGNDKFIEIYNTGAVSIPLEGCYIEKDGEKVWTAVAGYNLAAGGYLLLYSAKADISDYDSNLIFSGGLSAKKEVRVQLFNPQGKPISDFNYATYSGTKASASYGINSDGKWYYQDTATPGAVNVDGTVALTGLE